MNWLLLLESASAKNPGRTFNFETTAKISTPCYPENVSSIMD